MDTAAQGQSSLDTLRREIDEIDDEIHDLIMRRTEVALEIGRRKTERSTDGRILFRPAREAQIMRRLFARHKGPFPATVLMRIWREIISATLAVEASFKVSVYAPDPVEESLAYLALAKAYFGAETPLMTARTASGVLRAVRDGKAAVGVLPIPSNDAPAESKSEPWWFTLAGGGEQRPMIVARLPWLYTRLEESHGLSALTVARLMPEPSGDDVSLLAIESTDSISRNRIRSALAEVGLETNWAAAWYGTGDRDSRWQLAEIEDFVIEGDERLEAVQDNLSDDLKRLVTLGAYARTASNGQL